MKVKTRTAPVLLHHLVEQKWNWPSLAGLPCPTCPQPQDSSKVQPVCQSRPSGMPMEKSRQKLRKPSWSQRRLCTIPGTPSAKPQLKKKVSGIACCAPPESGQKNTETERKSQAEPGLAWPGTPPPEKSTLFFPIELTDGCQKY